VKGIIGMIKKDCFYCCLCENDYENFYACLNDKVKDRYCDECKYYIKE